MNIVSVLNKLKEAKMISTTEEGIAVFSDCFNKFGISLLLLKDEDKFSSIIDTLVEYKIPLQKSNGIYNLRIFAVDEIELKNMISSYSEIGEIDFLRSHPEYLAATRDIKVILDNMRKYQSKQISYKIENEYNMNLLLASNDVEIVVSNDEVNLDVNSFLKSVLEDSSLVDKVENNIANEDEEDFNVALELQKVENKICEEYLFPVDDGWKIIIDKKEVNTFQDIKDTINTIIKLNIPVTFNDALIFVLFYKTSLSVSEIEKIIKNDLFEGGM